MEAVQVTTSENRFGIYTRPGSNFVFISSQPFPVRRRRLKQARLSSPMPCGFLMQVNGGKYFRAEQDSTALSDRRTRPRKIETKGYGLSHKPLLIRLRGSGGRRHGRNDIKTDLVRVFYDVESGKRIAR
jgi:hypothetical protein